MRLARLFSLIAAVFAVATLVAPVAAAEPPFRLPDYVTDNSGALDDRQLAEVQKAVDQLYTDRRIRLWVVYVESFGSKNGFDWTQQTRTISDLSDQDALLAVATVDRSYGFVVPSAAAGGSSTKVDNIRRDLIVPALAKEDWAGAAKAAAGGLAEINKPSGGGSVSLAPLVILVGIGLVVIGGLMLWSRRRRRQRHEADVAAAKQVDPTDPAALASVPIGALDELSRSLVVEVDNAVRTSANELVLAVEEFGESQTATFAAAVDSARATLQQAFNVRQKLDDTVPEPLPERRDLLTRVVVSAAKANRELDAQTESFHQMRDLVFNAPERLDALTRRLVDVTAQLNPSQQKLTELHGEFAESALASVSRNVTAATERLGFAEKAISRGRELAAKPVAGEVGELVDCVRSAESALQQANTMLDAVDSAASKGARTVRSARSRPALLARSTKSSPGKGKAVLAASCKGDASKTGSATDASAS